MKLKVNDVVYGGFTSGRVDLSLDSPASFFSLTTTSEDAVPLPFQIGSSCEVTVDDELVLTGNIEVISVDGDSRSHTITIEGRSKTADVLDSTLTPVSDFKTPIGLKFLIEQIVINIQTSFALSVQPDASRIADLRNLAASDPFITVIEETKTTPFSFDNSNVEVISIEAGDNAFQLMDKYARFKQVLISCNAEGNIVIIRPSGINIDAFLTHRVADRDSNNVLNYSTNENFSDRFIHYVAFGQGSPIIGSEEQQLYSGFQGTATGDFSFLPFEVARVRKRLFVLNIETESTSQTFAQARLDWEKNIRIARSKVYGATVHGFRNQTGDIWRLNTLPSVDDEFAGISPPEKMLVNNITFSIGPGTGKQTTLALLDKNAYIANDATKEEEREFFKNLFIENISDALNGVDLLRSGSSGEIPPNSGSSGDL